jgi:hypothetical protein
MEDRTLLSTFWVTNTGDNGGVNPAVGAGTGTLRQAIIDTNADTANTAADTIDFNIPGSGVQTIQPLSPLPSLTHAVFIDGYSQPGSSPNILAIGDNAVLQIELDGSQMVGSGAGLTIAGGHSTVRGLDVQHFPWIGIYLITAGGDTVQGCFIGTDPTGEVATVADSAVVAGSDGNLIGTDGDGVNDFAERNVLSCISASPGATNGNVVLGDNNVVAGNYIGTDASGTKALSVDTDHNMSGVLVNNSNGNRIGADGHDPDPAAERNVISGNSGVGIYIDSYGPNSGGNDNVVAGNYIGTDASGTQALPNGSRTNDSGGISIGGSDNRIGTDGDGIGDDLERNIISGNGSNGVSMSGSNNVVAGNYIGTDVTGTKPLGNANVGVSLGGGTGNRIGTDGQSVDNLGERNIISANTYGIAISQTQGGHLIAGNLIGVAADGKTPLGNSGYGISVYDPNVQIGGSTALAKTIANNGITGVVVFGGTGVSIRANSIYKNQGYGGIDLGNDGVTLNGSHAGQTGPNNWQTFPVLSTAFAGAQTEVTGRLSSMPNTTFTIDFYANDPGEANAGAYGEGHYYLGCATVRTDCNGNASFDTSNLGASTVGQWISATATDPGGNTSEFCLDVQAVQAASTTTLTASAASPLLGQAVTFTALVGGNSGTPTGSVDFVDSTTNTDLGSVPLTNGVASLTTSALAVGGHTIVANYDGDTTYLASSASTTINVLPPANLSGLVYEDFNNDGQVDFGEQGIPGVPITVTGTDDLGNSVNLNQLTDVDGTYVFLNLRPGSYTITEIQQPSGYTPGIATVGTGGGTVSGDQFTGISLTAGENAMNYNYGEQPAATGPIQHGQTASIGFWNNTNGQALIKALNGGGTSTQLGNWLAATFPHMFGQDAGSNDLAGQTNASIASFFQSRFVVHGQKLDAQVLATALAVYVTDPTLDNTGVGTQYGFTVSGNGVATATYNVGTNGAAFGVADNTPMTVMDLLLAADAQAVNGVLYNGDTAKRNMANTVFSAINEAGDI